MKFFIHISVLSRLLFQGHYRTIQTHTSYPNSAIPQPTRITGTKKGESRLVHLFGLVENVGKVALAAVLTVLHGSHEDTSTTLKIISHYP